jgi:wobble nucleotide-excising tRNase
MITKFKSINNLAVFQNFDWDATIRDEGNNIVLFKRINIFYGRNYSGKTTLSRIVRALETGSISDKYENPQFQVCIKDVADTTQKNLTEHGKKIKVFNEDFVKDNLRYIINSNESVQPFAIIGGNATIEAEIQALKNDLGNNEEENESGFYLELKNASAMAATALQAYQAENHSLNQQLTAKGLDRITGIKYRSDRFGDQNYTTTKLLADIETILASSFRPLTDEEATQKLNLLRERANADVPAISKPSLDLKTLNTKVKELVTKSISSSNKIEQLLKDAILNRWVKEGRQIHKEKIEQCVFCGNNISDQRWTELDSHFDEESEKLENDIDVLISKIDNLVRNIDTQLQINKNAFYSKFHSNLERLISIRHNIIDKMRSELNRIIISLRERKEDLLNEKTFNNIIDNSKRLEWCWTIFEKFRNEANGYSNSLDSEQTEAKKTITLE